ncbi:MAG: NAD(P)-dependent oxidoreductase [Rhodospirillaceae bacterium]|nr:NAD(P)-dependent oxidoreductase [Rhodospirillaceae bacterium]
MKIAFIGLGVMGSPMAGHLAAAGHKVSVYNRTYEKALAWAAKHDGSVSKSPKLACEGADIAICCVGDDPDVESVVLGEDGMRTGLSSGTILVDHTTTSATLAKSVNENLSKEGIDFIDAPVSGGEAGAKEGRLTIMCGGTQSAFDRCSPMFRAYATHTQLIGPSGSGQTAKMVNQICIAGLVQALSEGIVFGQANGLDMQSVIDAISKGAAQSWQMENRADTMIEGKYEFGFAVDWMRKDLRICLEQARKSGVDLPVTSLVDQFYSDIQARNGGLWDTSSLIERLRTP